MQECDPRLRVVVAGGGIAALEALVALRSLAGDRIDLTVVAPRPAFQFRALALGEAFSGHDSWTYDLGAIAADMDAELLADSVRTVLHEERRVVMRSGVALPYDVLVLALGAHSYPAYAHGMSVDFDTSRKALDGVLDDLDAGNAPSIAVVVPDGVSWTLPAYELAVLLRIRAQQRNVPLELHLVTPEQMPAAAFGASISRSVLAALQNADINVRLSSTAIVMSDVALMSGGSWLTVSRILALPRQAGPRIRGLPSDRDGFIPVGPDGRVVGVDDVYAAGDGTTQPIKQGGLAAQQADAIAGAIARRVGVEHPTPHERRVLRSILTTTDGPLYLTVDLDDRDAPTAASRTPLWWPPTRVATRWLGPYLATSIDGPRPVAA